MSKEEFNYEKWLCEVKELQDDVNRRIEALQGLVRRLRDSQNG